MSDLGVPQLNSPSFVCPHCRALAHQSWYKCYAARVGKEQNAYVVENMLLNNLRIASESNPETFGPVYKLFTAAADGEPRIDRVSDPEGGHGVINLNISVCYSCGKAAIWRAYDLVYPLVAKIIHAHPDLPGDARRDFEEAAAIVDSSPRGAAALLRLAIQKLLKELGQSGDNINSDIGALVKEGLPSKIQRALDVVRVIGNNAVHPGEIDIRDDRATAASLFTIVNMIVESTITQNKQLDDMFSSLPDGALAAIEKRDKPKAT